MGFYGEQVLPRVFDRLCRVERANVMRRRVCAGLVGDVVEVGFGSGLNLPFYPSAVTSVAAIEPSDTAWRLAADRVVDATMPVHRIGVDGQTIPLPDHTADAALSTWTLCTIPDIDRALAELRRVLKPGGALHFVDHGLAPDESVRRWQHRLNPIQNRLAGGCHLDRPIATLLLQAGFEMVELDEFYEPGGPKVIGAEALGVAVSP